MSLFLSSGYNNSPGTSPVYHYAVRQVELSSARGLSCPYSFICIVDDKDVLVRVTHLQDFIADGMSCTPPFKAYNKKRCLYFTQMINYILVDQYPNYGISSVLSIEPDMMQDFFNWYAIDIGDGDMPRAAATSWECVRVCTFTMRQLVLRFGSEMKITEADLITVRSFRDYKGQMVTKPVPVFTCHDYSNVLKEPIFRELPTKAFELLVPLAFRFAPDIVFGICLQAFAGLRPGEVCCVRQENSPLGPGIVYRLNMWGTNTPVIDLSREYVLRSDGVQVGHIKKERFQEVYPDFLEAFSVAYQFHREYLRTCSVESQYGPMFVDKRGMAMTYKAYSMRFEELIQQHFIPALLSSNDENLELYGHVLLEAGGLQPHALRHFFTVQLVLRGLNAAQLMHWRGDASVDSANTYIQRKGELLNEARRIGKAFTESLLQVFRGVNAHG